MLMRKNVNNDVSKDSPIQQPFNIVFFLLLRKVSRLFAFFSLVSIKNVSVAFMACYIGVCINPFAPELPVSMYSLPLLVTSSVFMVKDNFVR